MPVLPLWVIVVVDGCEAVTARLEGADVLVVLAFVPAKTAL